MQLGNTFLENVQSVFDDTSDQWQWGIIIAALVFAYLIKKGIALFFDKTETKFEIFCRSAFVNFGGLRTYPIFAAILLMIGFSVCENFGHPSRYVIVAFYLVSAFSAYNLLMVFSRRHFIPRVVGAVMYLVLALSIFGWLDSVRAAMSDVTIPIGSMHLDVWKVLSGIILLLLLLWLVGVINSVIDAGTRKNKAIPPTMRVLINKASRLLLYVSAFLMSLKIAGVDLGALAFFSGALGLGLGFGLQKVISNLVSGVIILLDKSIKPGDVIEINGTYGWINTLRTRYVSVLTRDRKEILIPNEDFVTNKVVNWSFSDTNVRIKADVGIAYGADVEKAIGCCVMAAKSVQRVLGNPAPKCLLIGFGDSSIDLQIRFWINDANEGVANVRSAVLLEVWKSFKENGIEIPYPQREILIKNPQEVMKVAPEEV